MENVKLTINFIISFIGAIKDMITTLDAAMPDGTKGQEKLDVFKTWFDAIIAAEEKYAPAASMIWQFVVPLVSAIVAARKKAVV